MTDDRLTNDRQTTERTIYKPISRWLFNYRSYTLNNTNFALLRTKFKRRNYGPNNGVSISYVIGSLVNCISSSCCSWRRRYRYRTSVMPQWRWCWRLQHMTSTSTTTTTPTTANIIANPVLYSILMSWDHCSEGWSLVMLNAWTHYNNNEVIVSVTVWLLDLGKAVFSCSKGKQ